MSDVVWIHSESDFISAVDEGGKVVVDFTAPSWCVPCMRFAPHYERAASELKDVKFLAVDVDTNPWAALDYGIQSVPTVMLFEDGEFVRTVKAPQPGIALINDIKE